MKKILIVSLLLLGAMATLIIIRSVSIQIEKDKATQADYIITQSASPDGLHTVCVIGNGEPQWPFGSQRISIQFDDNKNLITTMIGNDGREADVQNIVWIQNAVSLELSGRNSPCQKYIISFDSNQIIVTLPNQESR